MTTWEQPDLGQPITPGPAASDRFVLPLETVVATVGSPAAGAWDVDDLTAGAGAAAEAGAIAVSLGPFSPSWRGGRTWRSPVLGSARHARHHRQATGAVHHHGAVALLWMAHAGAMSRTPWRVAASGGLPWAAPGEADVRHIVRDHGRCAAVAVEGGYDGVEIDATHRALPGQFLESGNDRGDGWGGAALNRRRLLVEIVQAVRGAVPDRIAVAVRLDSDVTTRTGMGSAEVHAAVLGSGADLVTEIGGGVVRVLARR